MYLSFCLGPNGLNTGVPKRRSKFCGPGGGGGRRGGVGPSILGLVFGQESLTDVGLEANGLTAFLHSPDVPLAFGLVVGVPAQATLDGASLGLASLLLGH